RTAVCEHDIRRLIPGLNGGDELSGCDVHDADGVGDVIDDPDLIAAHGKTYRIDADRKFARESERAVTGDIEDREAVVGGVERVELGSIGGQGDGVDLRRFEVDEVFARGERRRADAGDESGSADGAGQGNRC